MYQMCLKEEGSLPIMPPEAKVLIALLRKNLERACVLAQPKLKVTSALC